jgi:anti-anti-sigma factor
MSSLISCEPLGHRDSFSNLGKEFMSVQLSEYCLEVETREDAVIVKFTRQVSLCGELAESVANQLEALLSKANGKRLLVDFANVESLTSFMLGKLVGLSRKAEAAKRCLALFNLSHNVRLILEVARLNLVLSLYDDEPAALRS